MPALSYVHQLFNVDRCHAYIHTLRWKDRPRQCPRCQSHDVDPWGAYHYRPGCKRYRCHGCKRTFNDLTNTLLHQSKRSLPHWILATFLLCLACSSRRMPTMMPWYFSRARRLRNPSVLRAAARVAGGRVLSISSSGGHCWIFSGRSHSSFSRSRKR